jgi:hypothetical protein
MLSFQWQSQSQKCQAQVPLRLAVTSATTLMLSKERGETGIRVYQEDVLQGAVKHPNMTFFSGQERVF